MAKSGTDGGRNHSRPSDQRYSTEHVLEARMNEGGEFEYLVQWEGRDERSWVSGKYFENGSPLKRPLEASNAKETIIRKQRRIDSNAEKYNHSAEKKQSIRSPDSTEDGRNEIDPTKKKLANTPSAVIREEGLACDSPSSSTSSTSSTFRLWRDPNHYESEDESSQYDYDEWNAIEAWTRFGRRPSLLPATPNPLWLENSTTPASANSDGADESEDEPKGFARGLQPARIMGMARRNGREQFWIKWAGVDLIEVVSCTQMKEKYPQLVLDFYETLVTYVDV